MNKLTEIELEEIEGVIQHKERFKIENLDSANWALRKLKALEDKKNEIEMLAKIELDRINNWKKEELEGMKDNKGFFKFLLEEYYREQRELDPKFKLSTPYGKVTSRKQQPKWNYEDDKIIESLKSKGISELITTEMIEKVPKKEFKDSVEILQDVISLNGVIVKNVEPYNKDLKDDAVLYINTESGEIYDVHDYKYHKQAIVYNGQTIDGVTVEEREDSISIKVEL